MNIVLYPNIFEVINNTNTIKQNELIKTIFSMNIFIIYNVRAVLIRVKKEKCYLFF